MNLKVLLPSEILIDEEVIKVTAEAQNGSFCLLPKHIDFLAALVPGLLSFEDGTGREIFLAVDEGILVKYGYEVFVSTRNAVRGPDLGQLKQIVEEKFKKLDQMERKTRSAMAKIEAGFIRKFLELRK